MQRPTLSTGWIEQALGVSRAAVSDWRRGKFPERRQRELIEAVQKLLPDTTKEAPPWAEPLVADVAAIRRGVESEAIGLAALREALEAIQSGLVPPDDDPADDPSPAQSERKHGQR